MFFGTVFSFFLSSLMHSKKILLLNLFSSKLFVQLSALLITFYFLCCVNFSKLLYMIINFCCNLISCTVATRLYDIKTFLPINFPLTTQVVKICESFIGSTKTVFRWNYEKKYKYLGIHTLLNF